MNTTALDTAIRAVCPILGVSVGDPADRTTWRVDYDPSATDAQKAAAEQVVAGWTDAEAVPDNPTLGDWRVGLALWKRTASDGTQTIRLNDVTTAVQTLLAAGNPLALVAQQRLEYSNNVLRAELLLLKDAFGFTAAGVDESLHRAHQVSIGDLSGVWPLPTT